MVFYVSVSMHIFLILCMPSDSTCYYRHFDTKYVHIVQKATLVINKLLNKSINQKKLLPLREKSSLSRMQARIAEVTMQGPNL